MSDETPFEKTKSNAPKSTAIVTLIPITIKVYLIVSCFVGQVTLLNSAREVMRY